MADIIYGAALALYISAAFQSIIKSSQAFSPLLNYCIFWTDVLECWTKLPPNSFCKPISLQGSARTATLPLNDRSM